VIPTNLDRWTEDVHIDGDFISKDRRRVLFRECKVIIEAYFAGTIDWSRYDVRCTNRE
jgi:hypothetical protein